MKKITLIMLFASLFMVANATDDKMSVTTTNGNTITIIGTESGLNIDEYKGKIIFLEFFGHKCPPCIRSIPHYKRLQAKYKDKLAIVAIEVQGLNDKELKSFVKEKGINYTTISHEKAGNLIPYIAKRAQWEGAIPFLIVLDQKGNVQLVQAGMLPESTLENLIKKLSK
jgi:thiol-disulfide isomerase/thioredoxin